MEGQKIRRIIVSIQENIIEGASMPKIDPGKPNYYSNVINELLNNCRQSIRSIAESCKKGRQYVWRQIKDLEKKGAIWGYSAVIDEGKIGLSLYVALIKGGPPRKEVITKIIQRQCNDNLKGKEHIRIVESLFLNGVFDWALIFSAPSIIDAKRYAGTLKDIYENYIEEIQLLEVIFPVAHCGQTNPDINKLQDFAID